jgi:hypothetical protein
MQRRAFAPTWYVGEAQESTVDAVVQALDGTCSAAPASGSRGA